MQELFRLEPAKTQELVDEIVKSAGGVFLWVYLVVFSLRRGLGNCDQISDLQKKLRVLPKDLRKLYTYMILKVDDDYNEESTQFFQLLNLTQSSPEDNSLQKRMTILGLCLAKESEEDLPALMKRFRDSDNAMIDGCIAMSRRLNSRTGGLLEVQLVGKRLADLSSFMKVGYTHRTVKDFLMTQETILAAKTNYDAEYNIFRSSICEWHLVIGNDLAGESWLQSSKNFRKLYHLALAHVKRQEEENLWRAKPVIEAPSIFRIFSSPKARRGAYPGLYDSEDDEPNMEKSLKGRLLIAVEWGSISMKNTMRKAAPGTKRKYLNHALTMRACPDFPIIISSILTTGCDPFVERKQGSFLFGEFKGFLDNMIAMVLSQELNCLEDWRVIFRHLLDWISKYARGREEDNWMEDEAFSQRFSDATEMVFDMGPRKYRDGALFDTPLPASANVRESIREEEIWACCLM